MVFLKLVRFGEPGEVYNVGSSVGYAIKDMLDMLLQWAEAPIRLEKDETRLRKADEKTLLADISKLKNVTGWTPEPDMERTGKRILEYWRAEVAMRNGS